MVFTGGRDLPDVGRKIRMSEGREVVMASQFQFSHLLERNHNLAPATSLLMAWGWDGQTGGRVASIILSLGHSSDCFPMVPFPK